MANLKLDNWSVEKPIGIRIIAQDLATSANSFFNILSYCKENELPDKFNIPESASWLRLYYKSKYLKKYFMSAFNQLGGMPAVYSQTFQQMTQKHQLSSIERPNYPTRKISLEMIYNIHIQDIKDDLEKRPLTDEKNALAKRWLISTEFLFLLKVTLPCWLLYHENHTHLFKKAQLGEMDALDKLLRLDKFLLQNKQISKWITHYSLQKDKRAFESLADAIKSPPRVKITLPKVKCCLAGLISCMSELLNSRLTAPEIQNLFDAVAVDYEYDSLRDPDLPDSPEAFSKAIQRERNFWKAILPN